MSLGLICDACGATLLLDADVRYILHIRGFAAYDPLEITKEDLEGDLEKEARRLLEQMALEDPDSLQDDVFKEFQFDLCPRCWRRYRSDPLAALRGKPPEDPGHRDDRTP